MWWVRPELPGVFDSDGAVPLAQAEQLIAQAEQCRLIIHRHSSETSSVPPLLRYACTSLYARSTTPSCTAGCSRRGPCVRRVRWLRRRARRWIDGCQPRWAIAQPPASRATTTMQGSLRPRWRDRTWAPTGRARIPSTEDRRSRRPACRSSAVRRSRQSAPPSDRQRRRCAARRRRWRSTPPATSSSRPAFSRRSPPAARRSLPWGASRTTGTTSPSSNSTRSATSSGPSSWAPTARSSL